MADTELRTAAESDYADDNILSGTKAAAGSGLFAFKLAKIKAYVLGLLAGASTAGYVLTVDAGGLTASFKAPTGGGGSGVPDGGTTGQVLTKLSDDDGDADWEDPTGGAGGGGGTLEFISETVVNADSATIDIAGIPQTYRDLRIVIEMKPDGANAAGDTYVVCQFNGDSGNNYNRSAYGRYEGSNTLATSYIQLGKSVGYDNTDFYPIGVEIFSYSKTDRNKHVQSRSLTFGGGNMGGSIFDGDWKSNAAINSIHLFLQNGTSKFVAGSSVRLYGIRDTQAGNASNKYDFPIDEPPASPSAFNDEFEAAGSLANYAWVNQSSAGANASAKILSGMLRITTDAPIGGQNVRLLTKNRPAGDFDIVAKCRLLGLGRDYHQAILAVYNSTNGRFVECRLHYRGYGALYFAWAQWNSVTSGGTETNLATVVNKGYLRFKLTGTTLKTMISPDGYYWDLIHTEDLADFVGVGMDKIALGYDCETTAFNFEAAFEWIRDYGPAGPPVL